MAHILYPSPNGIPNRALFVMVHRSGENFQLRIYERSSGTDFTLKETTDLDNPEDERIILRVWTYDDILRASGGGKNSFVSTKCLP